MVKLVAEKQLRDKNTHSYLSMRTHEKKLQQPVFKAWTLVQLSRCALLKKPQSMDIYVGINIEIASIDKSLFPENNNKAKQVEYYVLQI